MWRSLSVVREAWRGAGAVSAAYARGAAVSTSVAEAPTKSYEGDITVIDTSKRFVSTVLRRLLLRGETTKVIRGYQSWQKGETDVLLQLGASIGVHPKIKGLPLGEDASRFESHSFNLYLLAQSLRVETTKNADAIVEMATEMATKENFVLSLETFRHLFLAYSLDTRSDPRGGGPHRGIRSLFAMMDDLKIDPDVKCYLRAAKGAARTRQGRRNFVEYLRMADEAANRVISNDPTLATTRFSDEDSSELRKKLLYIEQNKSKNVQGLKLESGLYVSKADIQVLSTAVSAFLYEVSLKGDLESFILLCDSNLVADLLVTHKSHMCCEVLERAIMDENVECIRACLTVVDRLTKPPVTEGDMMNLLQVAAKRRDTQMAISAWTALHSVLQGDSPAREAYIMYCHTFASAGSLEGAIATLESMPSSDQASGEPLVYYNECWPLVDAMGKSGSELDKSYFYLKTLVAQGRTVSLPVLNCLIAACSVIGDMTRARDTFDDLKETFGYEPDVDSFNALLLGYMEYSMHSQAIDIIEEMAQRGLERNSLTHNYHILCQLALSGRSAALDVIAAAPERTVFMQTIRLVEAYGDSLHFEPTRHNPFKQASKNDDDESDDVI